MQIFQKKLLTNLKAKEFHTFCAPESPLYGLSQLGEVKELPLLVLWTKIESYYVSLSGVCSKILIQYDVGHPHKLLRNMRFQGPLYIRA